MGRHRRSAAGRAATGRATGVTERTARTRSARTHATHTARTPDDVASRPDLDPEGTPRPTRAVTPTCSRRSTSTPGLPAATATRPTATPGAAGAHRRRKKRAVTPVKTGLLGVSAAVALGTVAVATGVVPGLDNYKLGGGNSAATRCRPPSSPTRPPTEQGGTSGSADEPRRRSATSRDADRSHRLAAPSPSTSRRAAARPRRRRRSRRPTPSKKPRTTPRPRRRRPKAPRRPAPPWRCPPRPPPRPRCSSWSTRSGRRSGCSPVAANSALAELAEAFSEDMAARGFFDHTDPDGATPWDRAAKAGITNLGGENIARGQADAAAVMEAWMNSPGHRPTS